MVSQERLKEILHYDSGTGIFTRISSIRSDHIGNKSGARSGGGYILINVDGVYYSVQRLAFLYMTGSIPKYVDHINRNPSDNRWSNLRPATASQNGANSKLHRHNKSGYRGVSFNRHAGKWIATIKINGKQNHLGSFSCKHHAFCEYVLAARKAFGNFAPY